MRPAHLDLGQRGEDAAAELLRAKGWRVLEHNVRLGRLELDLVCEDGDTLVFVEVKSRGTGALGSPADGLTPQKCERLLRAARQYLSERELWHRSCRFDLVAVSEGGGANGVGVASAGIASDGGIRAEHMENVLSAEDVALAESGKKTGSKTGGWQPW